MSTEKVTRCDVRKSLIPADQKIKVTVIRVMPEDDGGVVSMLFESPVCDLSKQALERLHKFIVKGLHQPGMTCQDDDARWGIDLTDLA